MICDCVAKQSKGSSEKNFKTQSVEEKLCSESLSESSQHADVDKMLNRGKSFYPQRPVLHAMSRIYFGDDNTCHSELVSESLQHTNSGEGKKKCAFTLAEVLITLTILGVIAAIAVPNIMHRVQDRIAIAKFKKTYAMLENAIRLMYVVEGYPESWDWPTTNNNWDNAGFYRNKLIQYIKHQSIGTPNIATQDYKTVNELNTYSIAGHWAYSTFMTPDGIQYAIAIQNPKGWSGWCESTTETFCRQRMGTIAFDINGTKGPNKYGYDMFFLTIGTSGIIINNIYNDAYYKSENCSRTSSNYSNGFSCSYWILHHNNMDYKKRDVSSEW